MTRSVPRTSILLLLAAGAAAAATLARPSAEWIRAELARILALPEYQLADNSWMIRMAKRIADWIQKVFGVFEPGVASLYQAAPFLYWAIVALLVAILAVLLYHIAMTIHYALSEPRRPRQARVEGARVSPDELRTRALALAQASSYAEALRLLHEATLRHFDRVGKLAYDSARTNSENLSSLSGQADLLPAMRPLTSLLDLIYYGGLTPGPDEFQRCLEWSDQAWQTAGST